MAGSRPARADLEWTQELQFRATSGTNSLLVDGHSAAGPSPVQLLVMALAGCMAADVVDILRKGRHPIVALKSSLQAERAPEAPRRLVSVTLHFTIKGAVPSGAVERAISLSRDKYCSVWHSLRQDITLTTSFDTSG
ncbi:MAG TPA: OsmC family protein [Vicinamibacterales bacterium]|nr:OsmC family protein [Vicinamibacterales bacterium]